MEMKSSIQLSDPGDDSVILRVIAEYAFSVSEVTTSPVNCRPLFHIQRKKDGCLESVLAVTRGDKRQVHFVQIGDKGWGLAKISPGVYEITPSIHVPGQLHAYVTIINVPETLLIKQDKKKDV